MVIPQIFMQVQNDFRLFSHFSFNAQLCPLAMQHYHIAGSSYFLYVSLHILMPLHLTENGVWRTKMLSGSIGAAVPKISPPCAGFV